MKINRETLHGVMRRVAPAVKGRSMPLLSMVHIFVTNGRFGAIGSDLDSFVQASCDCEGDLEEVCVSPGPLLALSEAGPDTMDLSVANGRLKVVCGSTASLSVMPSKEFPAWPHEGLKDLGVNPKDLADAIEAVSWAADPHSQKGVSARSVWIGMDTKKSTLTAFCLEGIRIGYIERKSIVPNATIMFPSIQSKLLCEALLGSNVVVKSSDSWLTVENDYFRYAVRQTEEFTVPIDGLKKAIKSCKDAGKLPKDELISELSTLLAIARDQFIFTKATFRKGAIELDYEGSTNEFHSVVVATPSTQSKDAPTTPNVAGVNPLEAPIHFNASLLHNVLRNTTGCDVKCLVSDTQVFFVSGDRTTGLALCNGNYK